MTEWKVAGGQRTRPICSVEPRLRPALWRFQQHAEQGDRSGGRGAVQGRLRGSIFSVDLSNKTTQSQVVSLRTPGNPAKSGRTDISTL